MERAHLSRSASGLRHLRWTREVLGSLSGLLAFDAHMSEAQRAALGAEITHVAGLVAALSAAVKPYRDFLERSRTLSRGRLRAAEAVLTGDTGLALPPGPVEAQTARAEAEAELISVIEPERRRLHAALESAIDATRDGLYGMEERLERFFSKTLVAGLFPALTEDRSRVLDDGDPDDDAAGA